MSEIVPSPEPSEVLHPVVEDVLEMLPELGDTDDIGEYRIQGERILGIDEESALVIVDLNTPTTNLMYSSILCPWRNLPSHPSSSNGGC